MLRAFPRAMPRLATLTLPSASPVPFPALFASGGGAGNTAAPRTHSALASARRLLSRRWLAQTFLFVARFSSDAAARPTINSAPTAPAARLTAVDLRDMDVMGARNWLVENLGISTKNADILLVQEVNGKQLLKASKDDLMKVGMPMGPAGMIVDAVAASAAAAVPTVTLVLKSGGKHGSTMPYTFTSAADFAMFATTHDIALVSKDGAKKKGVRSLAEAQSGEASDYLRLTAPFDSLDEDVSNLKRAGVNMSGGQEQATTKAILTSPSLRAEFGELRSIADGQGVIFFDHSGKSRLEVDGLVVNSTVVIVNEVKQTPTLVDVSEQVPRKALLEFILAHPSAYTTKPPDCLDAMAGITKVIPVISGYNFRPEVEAACKAAGVRCVKTNGSDYSSAI